MTDLVSYMFSTLNSSIDVRLLLGSKPLRVYPWAEAPQKPRKPYAVYSVINAMPENYVSGRPDIDQHSIQIDVYAETGQSCQECFVALRDALEDTGHMTSFQASVKDAETKLYSARLEFDIWQPR